MVTDYRPDRIIEDCIDAALAGTARVGMTEPEALAMLVRLSVMRLGVATSPENAWDEIDRLREDLDE